MSSLDWCECTHIRWYHGYDPKAPDECYSCKVNGKPAKHEFKERQ